MCGQMWVCSSTQAHSRNRRRLHQHKFRIPLEPLRYACLCGPEKLTDSCRKVHDNRGTPMDMAAVMHARILTLLRYGLVQQFCKD